MKLVSWNFNLKAETPSPKPNQHNMALNYIWMSFFLVAFVIAFIKWAFLGDQEIFKILVEGIFKAANDGFDISLKLIGVMSLFLGFMKIGERAGAINFLSRIVGPFFPDCFLKFPGTIPLSVI